MVKLIINYSLGLVADGWDVIVKLGVDRVVSPPVVRVPQDVVRLVDASRRVSHLLPLVFVRVVLDDLLPVCLLEKKIIPQSQI